MKRIKKIYSGVVVPMVTPFLKAGRIDPEGVNNIVNHLIGSGTHPFILGTTGESTSITQTEKLSLVKETVKAVNGRTTLYAGISGTCLREMIENAKQYAGEGVDVVVSTMPYYYPVDERQMKKLFTTLADSCPCPLIIYNIPSTTHLSIPLIVIDELSHHYNIVGLKDSEKSIERLAVAASMWKDREDFSFLLGWASESMSAVKIGADGLVPSSGNLIPAIYKAIIDGVLEENEQIAVRAQERANIVSSIYQKGRSLSHSISAFKVMLSAYRLCETHVLPPFYQPSAEEQENIKEEILKMYPSLNEINTLNL
ncbi:MAG: dihydrodipicolinate synthase family protein [Ginsengibacter sp.]